MIHYLLDAHVSKDLVDLVVAQRADARITSIMNWQGGAYLKADDDVILIEAHRHGMTLVTYDRATIPIILAEFAELGIDHSGVIFVDNRTIRQKDLGGLLRAIIAHWDERKDWDWTNRIDFLQRPY